MADERWQKIEAIFAKAVDMPPAEREAYLNQACDGDDAMRQEVDGLLSADKDAASFIDSPVFESTSFPEMFGDIDESVPPTFIGKKVGNYRLVSELGRGGMGAVFLAERDDSEFQKRVAVKLIKRGMDTDFILKRFRNERQILATLEHPNIAHLLDGGTTDDGLPFFIMEYIEGRAITEFCSDEKLSVTQRLQVFLQVCAAVEYAHQNSVIHRDLKPGNIMVMNDGTPKLLDFGIAKLLNPELAPNTIDPTMSLLRLMTPEYASPEQIRGETLTPGTDIYSLGVLLYELVTGRRPYRFPSRAPHEIARVICEVDPKPPSSAAFDSDLGALDNIIMKALEKDTAERYLSVSDLAADIQNYLDGVPVSAPVPQPRVSTGFMPNVATTGEARPDTSGTGSRGWFGRKAILALVLLALLVGGMGVYFYISKPAVRTDVIDSIAVLPFTNESGDPNMEYLSDGITESLINTISQQKGIKVIAQGSVLRYKGRDIDPQAVGKEMNVHAVLTGKIIQRGDTLTISAELIDVLDNRHLWGQRYEQKASDLSAIQQEIARQISRQLQATIAEGGETQIADRYTANPDAYQAYLKGRYFWNKRTVDSDKIAIDYFEQAVKADPKFALGYVGIADAYLVAFGYQFMPREKALAKAEEALQNALALNNNLGEAHASRAYILAFGHGKYDEAGKEFATAVNLNPNYATGHQWYSMYLAAMERREEASREMRTALDLDPLSLIINTDAVLVYYYIREFPKALEQCQKVRELDPSFWIIDAYEGLVYEQMGAYDKTIADWESALKRGPGYTSVIASLGHVYAKAGRPRDAHRMIAELDKLATPDKDVIREKAMIYVGLGDKEKALALFERAANKPDVDIFLKADPRLDDLRGDPRLADVLRQMGFPE